MRKQYVFGRVALVAVCCMTAIMLSGATERPRNPWVFRCVLDKEPRMVVIALHDDLWMAYDATDCSLTKIWRGDVKFDGAVYTTVHGPQPTSQGQVLYVSDADQSAWTLPTNEELSLRWKGYRFDKDQVTLMYELRHDGEAIHVYETPEYEPADQAIGTLKRSFEFQGAPASFPLQVQAIVDDHVGNEQAERVSIADGAILKYAVVGSRITNAADDNKKEATP